MRYRLLRVSLAVLVLSLVSSLTPLAQASPPDPTWLSGFYDNGDYDDVVLMVLSDVAPVEPFALGERGQCLVIVGPALPDDESLRLLPRPSSSPPRAPPVG